MSEASGVYDLQQGVLQGAASSVGSPRLEAAGSVGLISQPCLTLQELKSGMF